MVVLFKLLQIFQECERTPEVCHGLTLSEPQIDPQQNAVGLIRPKLRLPSNWYDNPACSACQLVSFLHFQHKLLQFNEELKQLCYVYDTDGKEVRMFDGYMRQEWMDYAFAFNGGVIYHGPGRGETFTVDFGSSRMWGIHT